VTTRQVSDCQTADSNTVQGRDQTMQQHCSIPGNCRYQHSPAPLLVKPVPRSKRILTLRKNRRISTYFNFDRTYATTTQHVKTISHIRLCPVRDAVPDQLVGACAVVSKPCCSLVSRFEFIRVLFASPIVVVTCKHYIIYKTGST